RAVARVINGSGPRFALTNRETERIQPKPALHAPGQSECVDRGERRREHQMELIMNCGAPSFAAQSCQAAAKADVTRQNASHASASLALSFSTLVLLSRAFLGARVCERRPGESGHHKRYGTTPSLWSG